MDNKCPFCHREDVVMQNHLAWAKYDINPVSPGHLLIMPCRHVENFFDTTWEERQAFNELLEQGRMLLDKEFQPDGYNIGINCGVAAGQTVMHMHIHLIPRYQGDLDDPRGGVRGVVPGKRVY